MWTQGVSRSLAWPTSWSALGINRTFWPVLRHNASESSRCASTARPPAPPSDKEEFETVGSSTDTSRVALGGAIDDKSISACSHPPAVLFGQKWTKAEDDHLRRQRQIDRKTKCIAHELGRSYLATKSRIARLVRQPGSGFKRKEGLPVVDVGETNVQLPEAAESVPEDRQSVAPSQNFRKWTDAEDDHLHRLRKAGFTQSDIAANLGRSVVAIKDRIKRLRLRQRSESDLERKEALPVAFSAEEDRQILALQAAGVPWPTITSNLGHSVRDVSERYYRHLSPGLYIDPLVQTKSSLWTEQQDDELHRFRAAVCIGKVAAKLGRSVMDCRRRLFYLRIQAGKRRFGPKKWSADEDNLILRLRKKKLEWKDIYPRLPNRSSEAVRKIFRMLTSSLSPS